MQPNLKKAAGVNRDRGSGQQTPLDYLGPIIEMTKALIIALAAVTMYLSRRRKKTPKT